MVLLRSTTSSPLTLAWPAESRSRSNYKTLVVSNARAFATRLLSGETVHVTPFGNKMGAFPMRDSLPVPTLGGTTAATAAARSRKHDLLVRE